MDKKQSEAAVASSRREQPNGRLRWVTLFAGWLIYVALRPNDKFSLPPPPNQVVV